MLFLDSAMLLITGGNPSSSISTLALASSSAVNTGGGFQLEHTFFEHTVSDNKNRSPGNMNPGQSVNELLDCCVMYYFAVAHKYIIMVSKVTLISKKIFY